MNSTQFRFPRPPRKKKNPSRSLDLLSGENRTSQKSSRLAEPPVIQLYFCSSWLQGLSLRGSYLPHLFRGSSAIEASCKEGGRREALTLRILRRIGPAPSNVSQNSSASPMAINPIAHVPIQWAWGEIARVVTQNLHASDFTRTSNAGFIEDPVRSHFLLREMF